MSDKSDKKTTGVFFSKSGNDYVVLWRGQQVVRYASIEEFVEAHQAGILALEESQVDLLEKYYRSIGVSTGRGSDRIDPSSTNG